MKVNTSTGLLINSEMKAKANPSEVFDACFNIQEIQKACSDRNCRFDNRLMITSFGIVRLQAIGQSGSTAKSAVLPSSSSHQRKKRKLDSSGYDVKMKELNNQAASARKRISEIRRNAATLRQAIKASKVQLKQCESSERQSLIEEQKQLKRERDEHYMELVEKLTLLSKTKKEKSAIYQFCFGDNKNVPVLSSTSSITPSSSSSVIVTASTSASAVTKPVTYYGVDPGVVTMAKAVKMTKHQAGSFLLLSNKYQPLEDLLDEDRDARRSLLNVNAVKVNAKDINNKSRNKYYQWQLNKRKS
ncbi:uncharacterized protein BX664DRAFT_113542 [Halteromyces radiatus]|uniref:uncharacterized protein n=1 Tax=Halteromyces radiatus TaxID=101107 RepID=UPI00221EE082|nr:uncharacterized protein BX664DRAFT_113542 [Halteromyces radiatus]KAI8093744.1 hypothetical protein BX664DRAFT_113542 [Halteromyces radiatus]